MKFALYLVLTTCFLPGASAEQIRSDIKPIAGIKYPNSLDEGQTPILVYVRSDLPREGFTELLPFVTRSPDQIDTGSCLYMSLTGNAEWWLARLNPGVERRENGSLDLSERHLMLSAGQNRNTGIINWRTDSIYHLNAMKDGVALNRNFPFTKGWFYHDEYRGYQAASPGAAGAEYGPLYNWVEERPAAKELAQLPKFRREVIFADPELNQWSTGVMPSNIAEQIKAAIVRNKAPVHVIYNHYGYWHATLIVGFDDQRENDNCAFVRGYIDHTAKRVLELTEALKKAKPADRESLQFQLRKAGEDSQKIKTAYARGGGCRSKGVFFVRDSMYPDPAEPIYDYDPRKRGEESPYSKPVVLLEYDWMRYMGNHAVQILLD